MENEKNIVIEDMSAPPPVVLDEIHANCIDCGEEFTISPAEQKFFMYHKYDIPKRCKKCRTKKSQYTEHICVDCGNTFKINETTRMFFERNGLNLPKRCERCREIKKVRNEEK